MKQGRIVLVDEYSSMNQLIGGYLTASGFDVSMVNAANKSDMTKAETAHLVIIDLKTAGDRFEDITKQFLNAGVPFIVLTSEHDVDGRIIALESGATDVLSRPLNLAELAARARAAISKTLITASPADRPPMNFGGLCADISRYKVELDGEDTNLQPKQIALLYLLMSTPDKVYSKAELAKYIGVSENTRTIGQHINRIKKGIGRYAENIVTVRGVGYKFAKSPKS